MSMTISTTSEALAFAVLTLLLGWLLVVVYDRGLVNVIMAGCLRILDHCARVKARRDERSAVLHGRVDLLRATEAPQQPHHQPGWAVQAEKIAARQRAAGSGTSGKVVVS